MSDAMDGGELILFEGLIFTIRGQRVILDADLARIYGATTKAFNQAFRRNVSRFPADFVFQLSAKETDALGSLIRESAAGIRSRFVTGSHRNVRYKPYAFTEHGAVMASMILNNPEAVAMSVYVVRAFIAMRRTVMMHRELSSRIDELERKYDGKFKVVFDAIRELMKPGPLTQQKIGFRPD